MELESNNPLSQGNASVFEIIFNGFNAIIGVGILSISYALASGGWLSLILLIFIASATCYAGLLTTRLMEANPCIKTYADIGEFAYGKWGKAIVSGVISCQVILVSVLFVGVFYGVGFHNKGELIKWNGIPTAMSLYMFSYGGNPVFPPLYTSMQRKHHFPKVILIGFLGATICYASMAVIGYLMFGPSLNSQITLNLPTHKLGSKVAIYMAWIAPLSKYALMMEPVASTTQKWFPNYETKKWFRIVVKTTLMASQVVVALYIPFFGALMSLVGTLSCATSSIIIPCL